MKILFSYLSERSVIVQVNGASAKPQLLPAGGPQGTVLGVIIFIVKFNGALGRPSIPRLFQRPFVQRYSPNKGDYVTVKYIDDATGACAINLKSLIPDPKVRDQPLTYNEQNQLILPENENPIKEMLNDLV